MRATYTLSKRTSEVVIKAIDLNPWLTSIGNTLAEYEVDAITGLVVTDDEEANVVFLTFSAGAAGHVYVVGINSTASDGQVQRDEVQVTVLGTKSGDQGGPGGGTGGAWGSITGSIGNQTDLTAALAGKASTASVDGLAVAATVNNALALKADTSTVNSALALKADASDLADLAGLSDLSDLVTETALATELADYATQTDLTNGLATKASTSAVALKANSSDMTTALALKANSSDMTTALAGKASTSSVALKADATALAGYSATGHTHETGSIENFLATVQQIIDERLIHYVLIDGTGAPPPPPPPPPAPSPTPAPAPGSGSGGTETLAPEMIGIPGIINPAPGVYVFVEPTMSATSTKLVDRWTITPRVAGTSDANPLELLDSVTSYMVDDSDGMIDDAQTWHAPDDYIGKLISFKFVASNDAGSYTDYTTSMIISASSSESGGIGAGGGGSGGGGGGEEPVGGTGLLTSLGRFANDAAFDISVVGTLGWVVTPTVAGAVSKSGGASITMSDILTGDADDASSLGTVVSWTGGTPTASGSTSIAVKSTPFSGVGAGKRYVVDADTTEKTFWWGGSIYSGMATITATLSDGSATAIAIKLPSVVSLSDPSTMSPDVGFNRKVGITFKAGSAAQTMTVDVTFSEAAPGSGGGNMRFQWAYLTS